MKKTQEINYEFTHLWLWTYLSYKVIVKQDVLYGHIIEVWDYSAVFIEDLASRNWSQYLRPDTWALNFQTTEFESNDLRI